MTGARFCALVRLAMSSLALAVCAGAAAAAPPAGPSNGADSWASRAHGVALHLTQLLPDQLRAFYLARGFAAADAELYATACVFMTVLRNDRTAGEIDFRLADWQLDLDGERRALPALDDWLARWRQRGVPEPAQIAFRWAQFPPAQAYAPGEWNQGMLAMDLPPGTNFRLIARWQADGKSYEGELTDVRCAPR